MNPKVDEYLSNVKKWPKELHTLREIILECGLTEDYKWRNPCYTSNGRNILFIGELKDSCVLSFIKGALLKDEHKILIQQTENSLSVRILKFTNVKDIIDQKSILQAYIYEAIEVQEAGLKVEKPANEILDYPEELIEKFRKDPEFKEAFEALTPGRKKGYILFFTGAKQSKSRAARIEKYTSRILQGKGIHDCVCGLSKRYPNCDGSHKKLSENH